MTNPTRRQFLKSTLLTILGAVPFAKAQEKNYTIDDYVAAVVEIESGGDPRAQRYEAHIDDTSYGLGQLLTRTAKDLEKRHSDLPRLGNSAGEIAENLCNPDINLAYTRTLFEEEMKTYSDPELAVAAYNAGHNTPKNARSQQQLNDLYQTSLVTDGAIGEKTKEVVKRFQRDNNLEADGILGPKTYETLQKAWQKKFPDQPNPKGAIPQNNYTPNHVKKFRKALEN